MGKGTWQLEVTAHSVGQGWEGGSIQQPTLVSSKAFLILTRRKTKNAPHPLRNKPDNQINDIFNKICINNNHWCLHTFRNLIKSEFLLQS